MNHASIYDIPQGLPSTQTTADRTGLTPLSERDAYVQSIEQDYIEHRDDFCDGLFFGPLRELMHRSSLNTSSAIRVWLQQDDASAELAITDSMDTLAKELTVVAVQKVADSGYATTTPLSAAEIQPDTRNRLV